MKNKSRNFNCSLRSIKFLLPVWAILLFAGCKKEKEDPAPEPVYVTFSLELAETNATILYNDSNASQYQVEYSWAVLIDSDSDSTTGNYEGYDVRIELSYSKQSETPKYGNLLSFTKLATWILEDYMGTSAHYMTAKIDDATNSLLFTCNMNWKELSSVTAGDKMKVETHSLKGSDYSNVGRYPETITDVQGDVPLPYMDIISLKVIQ